MTKRAKKKLVRKNRQTDQTDQTDQTTRRRSDGSAGRLTRVALRHQELPSDLPRCTIAIAPRQPRLVSAVEVGRVLEAEILQGRRGEARCVPF
jgi:hypothetical protein